MLNIAASSGQPSSIMSGIGQNTGQNTGQNFGNVSSGANAPEGLFSALVSLLSGSGANTDAASGQSAVDIPTQNSQIRLVTKPCRSTLRP